MLHINIANLPWADFLQAWVEVLGGSSAERDSSGESDEDSEESEYDDDEAYEYGSMSSEASETSERFGHSTNSSSDDY